MRQLAHSLSSEVRPIRQARPYRMTRWDHLGNALALIAQCVALLVVGAIGAMAAWTFLVPLLLLGGAQ